MNDRQYVEALARGLALLDCFRVNRALLNNGQLAELSGLPRSTVSRLTHTLVKTGHLEYDSQHVAYRLGAKVLPLSYAMLGGTALRTLVLPLMKTLADEISAVVALATCEDGAMLIFESTLGSDSKAHALEVGAHVSLDTSAMGRAYYASCSVAERERIIHQLAAHRKADTRLLQADLAPAVKEYRTTGYCTSIDAWRDGVIGIAVPIDLKDFGRHMVLTSGGPVKQLPPPHVKAVVAPALLRAARAMEAQFRRTGRPPGR